MRQLCRAVACSAWAIVLVTATIAVAAGGEQKFDAAGIEFFENKIRPVLTQHCYECHSAEAKIVQANLWLDTREGTLRGGDSGAALVPGESGASLIIEALRFESHEMPPKGKLPAEIIADFVKWIDLGAPDPRDAKSPTPKQIDLVAGRRHWAYQPPQLSPLPNVNDAAWAETPIDRYLLAALEAKNLRPVADADSYTWVRRVYLDLTGLPPTPEEAEEFVGLLSGIPAETGRARVREKLVDRLLASPQFGERWGRHWLDVVRYAESCGKERNSPYRAAWRYRDYVIDAFNADKPYDQFIREQLAGDLLPSESDRQRDEHLIATGFLAIGPKSLAESHEQYLLDIADEQLDVTFRAFLATTAGCARCHDHKFDPIPTADYYALIGIFRSTESWSGVRPPYRSFTYGHAVPLNDDRSRNVHREIAAIDQERIQLSSAYRNATRREGKDPERDKAYQDRDRVLLNRLAELMREIEAVEQASGPRFTLGVTDREEPADYAIRIRGEVADLGPVVPRGFLSVLKTEQTPVIDPAGSGRLELAQWISSRDHPLTARVLVNRLWQHLFGAGLVATPDDFGVLGERPSHPELLDYLAVRFMDEGWSVKRILREMALSRAYRLSSRHDEAAYAADPENRLLWRFSRRRLDGEAIRDSMLAASGRLDLRRPPGSLVLTLPNTEIGVTARGLGEQAVFRSAYLPILRNSVPEALSLFDAADPSLVVGRREITTVAPQSLYLMNSGFVLDQAEALAERLLERTDLDDAERVDLAYRVTLARPATDVERREALEFLRATPADVGSRAAGRPVQAWAGVCQALLGSAEFRYVY